MSQESTTIGSATNPARIPLEEAVHSNVDDVLNAAAADPSLTLDLALALLKRRDLPAQVVEQLGKNSGLMKSRKLKLAIVEHPRTPRHLSLPMVRHLFTFDLMKVALTPGAPADIRIAADEALANRLEKISMGERLSLAHRASERIARALVLDSEPRIVRAALENPRLTEASIIKALMRRNSSSAFVESGVPPLQVVSAPRNPNGSTAKRKDTFGPRTRIRAIASGAAGARDSARVSPADEHQILCAERPGAAERVETKLVALRLYFRK